MTTTALTHGVEGIDYSNSLLLHALANTGDLASFDSMDSPSILPLYAAKPALDDDEEEDEDDVDEDDDDDDLEDDDEDLDDDLDDDDLEDDEDDEDEDEDDEELDDDDDPKPLKVKSRG